jgi:Tol biopolymer transport system component
MRSGNSIREILFFTLFLLLISLTGCEREKAEEKIEGFSPTEERSINFGGLIEFMGYDIKYDIIPEIVYYWKATGDIKDDWTAFVHFVGPDGRIAFQNDHLLLSGGRSSSEWTKGELYKERFKIDLPEDVSYGTYLIRMGLWDQKTGIRLKIKRGFLKRVEEIVIGEFKVTPELGERLPDYLNGRIVFSSIRSGNFEIYIMDKDGVKRLTNHSARDERPVWSPDGSQIAFVSDRDGNKEIYIMDADGKNERRLTSNDWDDENPSWSPDGKNIVFESSKGGTADLYIIDIENKALKRLTEYKLRQVASIPSWSPDGRSIVFTSNKWFGYQISHIEIDGSGERRLTDTGGNCQPSWSPDGKKIAFVNKDGKSRIWLMDPDGKNKRQATNGPWQYDYNPSWSPDGKKIAYMSTEDPYDERKGEIFVVDLDRAETTQITYATASSPSWHN